ncbi:hypothetical protein MASR1M6_26950 [Rubrivivax sp.]
MVNTLIGRVIELRASASTSNPSRDGLHAALPRRRCARYRRVIAPRLGAAVASRIKLLAHLDIAERRLPPGRPHPHPRQGREIDLRVSTVPARRRERRRARARPHRGAG